MTIDDFKERFRQARALPLPGSHGQRLMAPHPRPGWVPGTAGREARAAGVLIPVYPRKGESHLLLTLRTDWVEMHRGQISFPGGMLEEGESATEAALREAEEEVGIRPDSVCVLGLLSVLHVPATGFNVTPVVGVISQRPDFRPSPDEVACCLEVPLARLLHSRGVEIEERDEDHHWLRIPYFPVGGRKLWGATAMILAELLVMLGWEGPER